MSENNTDSVALYDRAELDRRSFGWRTVFFGFLRSRRRSTRRDSEVEPIFTDWHHPWLFFLAVGTMLLSSLDAFMTLQLLQRGAVEINPVMDAVIGQSAFMFAATKVTLTGFGILVLVFLEVADQAGVEALDLALVGEGIVGDRCEVADRRRHRPMPEASTASTVSFVMQSLCHTLGFVSRPANQATGNREPRIRNPSRFTVLCS